MLSCILCVSIHHLTRLPTAEVLQLVAGRSRLPMPRGPGVPQIMEAQIRKARFLDRPPPNLVANLPTGRLVLEGTMLLGCVFNSIPPPPSARCALRAGDCGRAGTSCGCSVTGLPVSWLGLRFISVPCGCQACRFGFLEQIRNLFSHVPQVYLKRSFEVVDFLR